MQRLHKRVKNTLDKTSLGASGTVEGMDRYMAKYRQNIFSRYPLLFSFLVTFGVVSVWYGFDALIARIGFLSDRPLVVLFMGVMILMFTGTLYKKLSNIDHNL